MSGTLARTPCTVVTGFLGAGKTTIIRHLLENPRGKRLAVIVNEFGDVGVDAEILRGCGVEACGEDAIVELANGCLCCTVADDFVPALDALLGLDPPPDHILIETSGLALPKPLVQAFQWPAIKGRVTVDGVVTVVDGAALAEGRVAHDLDALAAQRAADPAMDHEDPVEEVFEDQLACADLVVLSKSDLLDEAAAARARAALDGALKGTLGGAPGSALKGAQEGAAGRRPVGIVPSRDGRIDPAVVLGLGIGTEGDIENRRTRHDEEPDHDHDDFDTVVLPVPPAPGAADAARRVAAALLVPDVLRAKGFAAVSGKPMRLLLQGVGTRVTHGYDRPWREGEARRGEVVVIGLKGFDRAAVEAALAGG